MKLKQEITIPTIKPGRKDYSREIFIINVPVVRKHQIRSVGRGEYEYEIPPNDFAVIVGQPDEPDIQYNIFNVRVEVNPNMLFKFYFGWFDIYKFITTPETENDLLNTTTFGPFGKAYKYGTYEVNLISPVTYIPSSSEWMYIFAQSLADATYTFKFRVNALHFFRDEYYKR